MECYVCHESVALPPDADRATRWIHTHCNGTAPTVAELVAGFVAALPSDRFCMDCLARLIGVMSRRDVDAALATLGRRVHVAAGRCARCPVTTRVVGASPPPTT